MKSEKFAKEVHRPKLFHVRVKHELLGSWQSRMIVTGYMSLLSFISLLIYLARLMNITQKEICSFVLLFLLPLQK